MIKMSSHLCRGGSWTGSAPDSESAGPKAGKANDGRDDSVWFNEPEGQRSCVTLTLEDPELIQDLK